MSPAHDLRLTAYDAEPFLDHADRHDLAFAQLREGATDVAGALGGRKKHDTASPAGAACLTSPGAGFDRARDRALDHGCRDDWREPPPRLPLVSQRFAHRFEVTSPDGGRHGRGRAPH